MKKRPDDVVTVASALAGGAGCLLCFVLILTPFAFLQRAFQDRLMGGILLLLMLTLVVVLFGLAYGYYELRSWAYKPVKTLVGFEDRLKMLRDKVDTPEVREAFGLEDDSQPSNETRDSVDPNLP